MSTTGMVIRYIGGGCQFSEPPGNNFDLHNVFREHNPGIR